MKRLILKLSFASSLFSLIFCLNAAAQPPRTFPHPDRIRYDSQCLTIDGRDMFIYSGAFHYFRCPKELWPDRFRKIKDAGFNTVETYVAWNWCEPEMPSGTNDFSKVQLQDFDDWLTMAEKYGLYVIVRPGPYICAEWDTGGYPRWLSTKKPAGPLRGESWLRSDDPVYLSWCKHWYDAVCPVIAKHQVTRKAPGQPGVILVQVENEYDYAKFSDAIKINQVKALAEYALADGIDVPLITCWTHQVRGSTDPVLRLIFDCCNFYPRWAVDDIGNSIRDLRRQQPDAPLATTELQGGWFSNVGGQLSQDQDGLTASQINNLTLFAIQNGESILNYYMLFGGTNPGDHAARGITTTYDYNAPIREWGGVGDRYQRVWAIGHMLQEHGAQLARSTAVNCDVTTAQDDVTVVERRAPDGGRYFFVRTSQHRAPREGQATVREKDGGNQFVFNYQLESFGSKILYLPAGVTNADNGEWLPHEAPAIARPDAVPAAVTINATGMRADGGPTHWRALKPGEAIADAGIDDSHFIYYRANVSCDTSTNLLVDSSDGDAVLALVNGEAAAPVRDSGSSFVFKLPAGHNRVTLLYENQGYPNGGIGMENPYGIADAHIVGDAFLHPATIPGWRMKVVEGYTRRPEVQPDFDDANWESVDVDSLDARQLSPNQDAVFRTSVDFSDAQLKAGNIVLSLGRVDDNGWVYVNGRRIGKTTDWSRAYSFDITKDLHAGRNVIAVVVENIGGPGGLGQPTFSAAASGPAVVLAALGRPAGDDQQWWKPGLKETRWASVAMGAGTAAPTNSILTWYRMGFSLPPPQAGVWAPWRLHLEASGNGFLYLNGHPIGRYWNVGPQHDFFLPECWLHFGDGQVNNITLNLRPTEGGAGIQSAVVEPYQEFAEKR